MEEILLNVECKETRCAHLKNGQLHNLIIERKSGRSLTGNIYRGRITNLLHNIQSAFVDIGEEENGFIHLADAIENNTKILQIEQENTQIESESGNGTQGLRVGQWIIVQVIKEPIRAKGARLTSFITLAGRYVALLPTSKQRSISKKITQPHIRARLSRFIKELNIPSSMGIICRTASKSVTKEALEEEVADLIAQWEKIVATFKSQKRTLCLYRGLDLVKRTVLYALERRFQRILADEYSTYQTCQSLLNKYGKEQPLKIEFYRDRIPMFERFGVEREIEKTLKKKIWLPSGGYIFFETTEAMHTIDVNSGRSFDKAPHPNLEETLVRINLEAAEEASRQLRLRNIGGIIICDFIDMTLPSNQKRILDRLKECMQSDPAKCSILNMSRFGTVQMTRQRLRESLAQTMLVPCPYCQGASCIKSNETVSIEIERTLKRVLSWYEGSSLKLLCHPEVKDYLEEVDKNALVQTTKKRNIHLEIEVDDALHLNDFVLVNPQNGEILT
ncbi:Rne/Rng family ribonuclease [Candidatus Similichlamydia laticola]|uniref:Ribonuclease G n=1 Tax=Candidatus Similichlamydia laticola TaxID=2170265 RepID=A0A369KHM8_9BACT|nr:Rne/Rng family ribonuclease [Candidatus Similichlamydia laticola]RDB31303.1 Cytoplasmic axial filament protein CafA and Ribonuclease G [Candidatus Similichlamydia laticola]